MMKRRILALMASAALTICCLCVPAMAAGNQVHSYNPIYVGDAETDYLADQVLAEIPTSGKTDAGKLRAVYEWIETHCVRTEWDGTYWFDESEVSGKRDAYAQTMKSLVTSGAASLRVQYTEPEASTDAWGFTLSYDSNAYVASFAKEILYTRSGNCAHFSALLTVLLGHLGYDCRMIDGVFINLDGSTYDHVWNCVLVDGQYYWMDMRMDQANYVRTGELSEQYFMRTDKTEWEKSHKWDETYSDWLFANAAQIAGQTETAAAWSSCSDWAKPYLEQAQSAGLIPDSLRGSDMTKDITRAEFAGAAVALYEALSGRRAPDAEGAPFSDTSDSEVLQAYALGIVGGVGGGRFAPASTLTREQAAAMLGRVYELVKTGSIGDGAALGAEAPGFTDAAQISAYARNYIGFFYDRGILDGIGGGAFAPKGTVTREQALKIAAVCAEKLG